MSTWTTSLIDGLAQLLHDAGLGVYRPTGTYAAADIAVVAGVLPPMPDRVYCLSLYGTVRPSGLADVRVSIQGRARGPAGDSRSADYVADPIRDYLDGYRAVTVGGIRISQILHASGPGVLGLDGSNRPGRTDNFAITAERPTTHYPD
ncbi:hypothetical protein B4N89_20550 [Embleya scabrispora]|uniref:Tail terminator n=1 Tax=Embleya scabrispora TaxID=159449 RepID=A0A1T3P1L6_9ACTN|nr:minor capsid protein [Embleya scabrispora]OPC83006.1 hypothetical protein B4N89_20550 [Embleya scabrispora]